MGSKSGDGSTDWMYNQNSEMNKEEYLLGKAVGKDFEREGTLGQINAVEYDCAPPSIFASQAQHQVDLQRKLMEDPLVALKKREMEDRRQLLNNPVKMKALQEHIKAAKKSKKDKKKKKKKKKKKSSSSDSDSDSDADLDSKLLRKIQNMESHFTGGGEGRGGSPERRHKRSPERRKKSQSPRRSPRTRRSRSPRRSPRRSPPRRERRPSPRRRSPSPDRASRRRSPRRESSPHRPARVKREKIDDAEKERRLKEMMENAEWREEQRSKNVKRYKIKEEKEEQEYRRDHDPEFLRKQLNAAAESSTVESRIKSNKYNIQRGSGNMDKNFARR